MAIAVYRGVAYDTNRDFLKEAAYVKTPEVYRGVKHTEVRKVEVRK